MGVVDRTDDFRQILQQLSAKGGGPSVDSLDGPVPQAQSELNVWSAEIGSEIHQASVKVQELRKMARKKGIFEDKTSEIQELTFGVKQDIQGLNQKIEALERKVKGTGPNRNYQAHSSNMVETLKTRLMEVTKDFKDALEDRTRAMEQQDKRRNIYGAGQGAAANPFAQRGRPAPSGNAEDLEGGGGAPPRRAVEWRVKRRMRHLREGLHDPVKAICGRAYMQLFQGAHFAFHTSWPGTTDRLNAWLGLLASSIDSGAVAPSVAALALHFLEPPSPGEEAPDPGETDYSELARLQEAARGADPADVAARMAAMSLRSEDKQKYSRWYWWLMPVPG
mmetsp:Transcript_84567/g.262631  ORF Transcript_84567/g.262631 Transcript_84567/m.262631 type:complete len:335 (-) Transcript_84567:62-1066(-)